MMRLLALVLALSTFPAPLISADPTTLRAIGIIERYDPGTCTLLLATSIDVKRFTLESTVRIRQGRRTLVAADLAQLIGYRASVRYLDGGRAPTVESIHVWQVGGKGDSRGATPVN
ncbi:MAG TPA: hypothetical protein VKB50_21440 [Vicinamibacterales bacterium]|nr:hypothetical protein [Vicinamibacterales bacterium]